MLIRMKFTQKNNTKNRNLFYGCDVIVLILVSTTQGLLLDSCSSDDDCTPPATCKPNGCKGNNCLCPPHTIADETLSFCQSTSRVGSHCDDNIRCLSKMATCESNTCRCADYFRTSSTSECSFRDERLIGESCTKSSECAGPQSVCMGGSCSCAQEFRIKTCSEYWTDPLSTTQCVSDDHSLEYCGSEKLPPVESSSETRTTISPNSVVTTENVIEVLKSTIEPSESSPMDILFPGALPDAESPDVERPDVFPAVERPDAVTDGMLPPEVQTVIFPVEVLPSEIEVQPTQVLDGSVPDQLSVDYLTESAMFETYVDSMSYDSDDGQIGKTSVLELRRSDDLAPSETVFIVPSTVLSEDSQGSNSVNGNSKDTDSNDFKGGFSSANVVTNEDVKIIISLLGTAVGILAMLAIFLMVFKFCRTGATRTNTVSPEPQENSPALKSVVRQRSLFKERW